MGMGVVCNGPRKAGTHLLLRCVEALGFPSLPGIAKPGRYDAKGYGWNHDRDWLKNALNGHCVLGHLPYRSRLSGHTHIVILRDPRNLVVSYMRWWTYYRDIRYAQDLRVLRVEGRHWRYLTRWLDWRRQVPYSRKLQTLKTDKERLLHVLYCMQGKPLYEELSQYTCWFGDDQAMIVRFEDLCTDPKEVERVAWFLGIREVDPQQVYSQMRGATQTFTGRRSDWRKYWDDNLEHEFQAVGGGELLREWKYA